MNDVSIVMLFYFTIMPNLTSSPFLFLVVYDTFLIDVDCGQEYNITVSSNRTP